MIILVERCLSAVLTVDGEPISATGKGLAVFVGITTDDTAEDVEKAADKISGLRIFQDNAGKMNLSVCDIGGEILVVSNFTLCGNATHGKRPEFMKAAKPEQAEPLYEELAASLGKYVPVKTGVFGADMRVMVENDGPVNILYDTKAGKIK